jgi:uncharacterized protein (DUF2342 family)
MGIKMVGAMLVTALLGDACTTYTSLEAVPAPASETIRLSLTDEGRTQTLGPLGTQVSSVEGEVRSVSDTAITMSVEEVGRVSSDAERFHGVSVTIPSRYIVGVERKHVQVRRSLMIAGAIIGGAFWIASQGHGDVTAGPPGHPPIGGQ